MQILNAGEENHRDRFDLARYTMFYFAHILQRNAENMAASLQPMHFDNSTWRLLATLQYKSGLTIKELANFAVLERSFVGRLVAKLETEGLVRSQTSPSDRRAVTVSLTPKGHEVFREVLLPAALRQEQSVFAGISDEEMQVLFSVLSRALENVYRAGNKVPPI